tara:strand:- start:860 stop:2122 length:1263 start_codon:yes stop_codon:yes gene_type:complete
MATVTGTQRQLTHTSNTYESNTTIDVAGNITVGGTVDGIDIAGRDACLTATINTACAALPKAGGAMTGAITTNSTFDGRNVSVDGAKLDGICCGATTCTGDITSVVAGAGLTGGATSGAATLCHSDTSAQGSIYNTNGTVVQGITLDTYGHVGGICSYNLDSRYYTETESDGRYLRNSVANSLTNVLTIPEASNGNIVYDLDNNGVYIPKPIGASYHTLTNAHTGAIAIKLPTTSWNNSDMVSFHVDIYDYAGDTNGESVTLYIYGYHQGALSWANVGAVILSTLSDRDYTVRFGHDGTRPIVWIGETTSTWNFPQIIVRDFQAGYTANHLSYDSGWEVVPNVTSFGTISKTSTGNYPYAKAIIRTIYTVASLPSASPAGQREFVEDSSGELATSVGQTLTAGGSNTIPVYSDGSSWRAG